MECGRPDLTSACHVPNCGEILASPGDLAAHIIGHNDLKPAHPGGRPFSCGQCFSTNGNMRTYASQAGSTSATADPGGPPLNVLEAVWEYYR